MSLHNKISPLTIAVLLSVALAQLPLAILLASRNVAPGTWVVLLLWSLALSAVIVRVFQQQQSRVNHKNTVLHQEIASLQETLAHLKIENQRFSTVFYKSPVPIAISTRDDEVIDINQAGLNLLGVSREAYLKPEALKLGSWAMIPDREKAMGQFNEYGLLQRVEMPVHSADGRIINTLAFIESIVLDNQLCKLIFALDINDYYHTQERLLQFRRDLHAIARAFSDLYFRVEPDGTLSDYMSGSIPALGLMPEVFLGKNIADVLPSDAAKIVLDGINIVRQQTGNAHSLAHTVEYELKLDRQRRHFEIRMVLEDNQTILAIAREITERKEQDLKLIESEELFRQLTTNINEVMFIRDLNQQKLIYISDLFFTIRGFGNEQIAMSSSSLTQDVHPADLKAVQLLIRRQKRGEVDDIEYRVINPKTQETRWLRTRNVPIKNSAGEVHRVAVLSEDITFRKASEETLRQNENKFRTLTETMPAAVGILREDSVLFVNSEMERLTGYSLEEIQESKYFDILNSDDPGYDRQWISKRLATSDVEPTSLLVASVQRIKAKDGAERWIQYATNIIEMQDGKALLIVGVDVTALQLTSEALRQREEEFRAFVENSPDQIARFDRNLCHLYVNPALLARSQASLENYLGKSMREVGESQNRAVHIEGYNDKVDLWEAVMWKVIETGEEELIEDIHRTFDGSTFFFETRFVPEFGKDGMVETLLSISRDITESKRAESERRESELMLRQFAENMNEILVVRDAHTQKAIYISPAFEKIWGLPSAPLMQDPLIYKDYVVGADRDAMLKRVAEGRYEPDMTYRIRRPDGELRWLRTRTFPIENDLGEVYRLGGLVEDFTGRKQIEDTLRENQAIFNQMADNIKEVLFVTDVATSNVIYITPSCVDLWGLTQEQIMEDSGMLVSRIHPEDLPHMIEKYSTRQEGYSAEYRIIRTDGQVRWVRSRVFPIRDEKGEPYRITGMVEDITERKQMDEDAHERDRLAIELEKQKSFNRIINHFVAMVSHEFRTPLAVILSSGRMLETYADRMETEQRANHLKKITEQTIYMRQLMEEVLTYQSIESRKSEFTPETVNLVSYSEELIEQSHIDRENPRIIFTYTGDLREVVMDKKLLRHIITNLLTNAQKYSDDKPVEFSIERKKSSVILEIKDQGIGIPEIYHNYLFEPFRRAENVGTRRGTGLGLAIVKMSVDAHKGHISFQTEINVGTTFSVHLPAMPSAPTPILTENTVPTELS
ncbi:MAG: PAS domain S-box protein [Aggregatilineales bacterium]